MLTLTELALRKPAVKDTLKVKRIDMPQINGNDYDAYLAYMKKNGVTFTKKHVAANKLKATQKEFHDNGVIKSILKGKSAQKFKPLIVSNDNYIIDGHHRWLAKLNTAPNETIEVLQASVNGQMVLQLTTKFPKAHFKGMYEQMQVDEQLKVGQSVLYVVRRPAIGLKTKTAKIVKIDGDKIHLSTSAILHKSDQVRGTDEFDGHHDFMIKEQTRPITEMTKSVINKIAPVTKDRMTQAALYQMHLLVSSKKGRHSLTYYARQVEKMYDIGEVKPRELATMYQKVFGLEEGLVTEEETEMTQSVDEQFPDTKMGIKKGEMVRVTNPRATARYKVLNIKGQTVTVERPDGKTMEMPLSRIQKVKAKAAAHNSMKKEETEMTLFEKVKELLSEAKSPLGTAVDKAEARRQKVIAKAKKMKGKGMSDDSIKKTLDIADWEWKKYMMAESKDEDDEDDDDNKDTDDKKGLDKVDKKQAKGDFEDREDKDIDNDGDSDDSDEYLHNRRKKVTKAAEKDEKKNDMTEAYESPVIRGARLSDAQMEKLKIHIPKNRDDYGNTKKIMHKTLGKFHVYFREYDKRMNKNWVSVRSIVKGQPDANTEEMVKWLESQAK